MLNKLKAKIHDDTTNIDYILAGGYYIPAIVLLEDDEPLHWKMGRMHRAYLEETNLLLPTI